MVLLKLVIVAVLFKLIELFVLVLLIQHPIFFKEVAGHLSALWLGSGLNRKLHELVVFWLIALLHLRNRDINYLFKIYIGGSPVLLHRHVLGLLSRLQLVQDLLLLLLSLDHLRSLHFFLINIRHTLSMEFCTMRERLVQKAYIFCVPTIFWSSTDSLIRLFSC